MNGSRLLIPLKMNKPTKLTKEKCTTHVEANIRHHFMKKIFIKKLSTNSKLI